MNNLSLQAHKRILLGKKVKKLRQKNQLPSVLYGHGIKPEPLTVNQHEFEKIYKIAGKGTLVSLEIDKKEPVKILIHQTSRHPVTGELLHADLYQVKMTEKIHTEIPVVLAGVAPAAESLDANIIRNKDHIEIECLPNDLIPEISVDISGLKKFGDTIYVKDLKVPQGVEILDDREESVVLAQAPISEAELEKMEVETAPEAEKAAIEEIEAKAEAEKAKVEEGGETPQEETPAPQEPEEQKK